MASSFFSPKSRGTRFLTAIANLILVNIIFVITSLPVFTLGASVTSLYRITIAILAGDNPSVFRDYMRCFRDNFFKATGLLLFYAAAVALFVFEVYMVKTTMPAESQWVAFTAYFFLILLAACSLYTFPLLAWFDETYVQLLKNSLFISITNLPVTIMYLVISAGFAYLVYQFPTITLSGMIFMGFAVLALFYSLFLKKIFEKLGAVISFKESEEKD